MVTIPQYKKVTIDHAIYIKILYAITVYYLAVSTYGVINTNNNETDFTELRKVFEEAFEIKFQEGSVLRYPNFRIFQSTLGFSVDQNDSIMELVNEWLSTEKFRKDDTPFRTDATYELHH